MKRNILILGGNGFIGTNLCNKLIEEGNEVFSFDLSEPVISNEKVNYICGDFFDLDVLKEVTKDKDIIFHAISTINPGNSNSQYMRGYTKDFIQTIKLCEIACEQESKLIFLSSGGTVYGDQIIQPIDEEVYPKPINHYGNIKLCIENTIRTFNIQNNTKFIIARISNPYGPGQDYSKGVGFIDAAIKRTISNEVIEIWGDGTIERDYIYIDNVCDMLVKLMNYDGKEEVFNLSSNRGVSLNEILGIMKKVGLEVDVCYKPARSVDVHKIILNNKRIKDIYNEKILSIEEGIEKYYNYLMKI